MKLIFKILCLSVLLTACQNSANLVQLNKYNEWEYQLPEEDYIVTATGYAPIDSQLGDDKTIKMLKAIKVSKLDAYRDLSEKVHGYRLNADVTVNDLIMGDEKLRASVQGVIKGARLVKAYPLDGVYITELELNLRDLYRVSAFTNGQTRIINSKYF
ncbi:LPP20 family lipoprotein [Catenovulum sp. 2E275]|uniref:LPP20 family lipoprotein n=1 Tax=Catenovulum sp. 2E275 TaxID=2980497 RepID=UPI0021CF3B9A|nr:LPP20 family lipoprotein [Catenovulum sp. 2E275]MCU4676444.1 LPP20 family lipoprotein [Catenovulum sp. 2E275]